MRFTNSNQFEKMMRLDGTKNYEDIWDIDTYDKIKSDIEKELPNIKEFIKGEAGQVSHNIKEFIDSHEFSIEKQRCLDNTRVFCSELSMDFKKKFLSVLEQYSQERRQISQKIVDYLLEKNLVLPSFTIADREQAYALLEEYGLGGEIDEQSFLLVFQLPKPLAQFWWKGGSDSCDDMSVDVKDEVIEWGHFYRKLMSVVWEVQGHYENERGLDFRRVNDVGEHDPKKYYYVWKISGW